MEVFVNPGVVGFRDDIDGIRHQYLFLRQHRYTVGDGVQRVEVVGDQEHAQAQRIAQATARVPTGSASSARTPAPGLRWAGATQ
eukprot:gene6310-7318_t